MMVPSGGDGPWRTATESPEPVPIPAPVVRTLIPIEEDPVAGPSHYHLPLWFEDRTGGEGREVPNDIYDGQFALPDDGEEDGGSILRNWDE